MMRISFPSLYIDQHYRFQRTKPMMSTKSVLPLCIENDRIEK